MVKINATAEYVGISAFNEDEVLVTLDVKNENIDEVLDSISIESIVDYVKDKGYSVSKNN